MGIDVVFAALFAGVAFLASGFGSMLLGRSAIEHPLRALAAEYLVGLLAYSALFGLAAHLQLPFGTAVRLALIPLVLAVLGCIRSARSRCEGPLVRRFGKDMLGRLVFALVIAASLCALWPVRGNPVAADPRHYAYLAAAAFHDEWLQQLASVPEVRRPILDVHYSGRLTRAPEIAMLWPPAAFARGVDIDMVTQVAAWFLGVAFVLLVDILSGLAPLLARVMLAAGGIGAFNVASVLTAGQVNQPVALVAILTAVWICRYTDGPRARLLTLTLVGYVLAAGYPEFLVAVPLYFGCIVVLRPTSWRRVMSEGIAIPLGALSADLTTGFTIHRYIASQSAAVPGWHPLYSSPQGVGGLWARVLLQHRPHWWLVLIVIFVALYLWRSNAKAIPLVRRQVAMWRAVGIGLTFMVGLWSWAVLGAGNVNYATFKMTSWLGPGLMLLGWASLQHSRPAVRWGLGTMLLTVAVFRCVVLPGQLPTMSRLSAWHPVWTKEIAPGEDSRCVVRAISQRYDVVLRAIAESAAPARGCALAVGGVVAVASVYEGRPPANWQSNEAKTYVVGVENAGAETWAPDGAGAVRLGVRFVPPGSDSGEWISFALPRPVHPEGRTKVRVEISAPGDSGTYILQHRMVQGSTTWSEQVFAVRVSVN